MEITRMIKTALILGTLMTVIHQWAALIDASPVDWLALFLCYGLSFLVSFWLLKAQEKTMQNDQSAGVVINPKHIEALYKQAGLVERNAHKANAVFIHQLQYIKKLLDKTKNLEDGADYDLAHQDLVKELSVLEQHVELIASEMNKNVKLGEKLQQSVANIDPEIGLL
jgi:hypothetical protein